MKFTKTSRAWTLCALCVLCVCLTSSCGSLASQGDGANAHSEAAQNKNASNASQSPEVASSAKPAPEARGFGDATVARSSERKDKDGSSLPPWTRVEITNIGFSQKFKSQPRIGERVTVLSLGVELPALELKIAGVDDAKDECTGAEHHLWAVTLEDVTRRDYFDQKPMSDRSLEYPFDALVIYPANPAARVVSRAKLSKEMLPRSVTVEMIRAAVDTNADGAPELLLLNFCCDDPKATVSTCELTCGKIYRKTDNVWTLIDTIEPC